eukprot:g41031.t1
MTLKRCYSRVKERGRGKRTCNYTFQQLEQVFGRVPVVWEPNTYQPVLIDSSGLYQDAKSDTINLDDSREVQPTQLEDWGNQKPDLLIKQELLMNQKQELQAYQKQDLSVYQDADEDIARTVAATVAGHQYKHVGASVLLLHQLLLPSLLQDAVAEIDTFFVCQSYSGHAKINSKMLVCVTSSE